MAANCYKLKNLKKIKELNGFVTEFLICGPFNQGFKVSSCKAFNIDYMKVSKSESKASPVAYQQEVPEGPIWKPYSVKWGYFVNLRKEFSTPGIVSYAVAYIDSDKSQKAKVLIGSDDGFKLYLNRDFVAVEHEHRGLSIDNNVYEIKLKKGINIFLIKTENKSGAYEFCMRLTDKNGKQLKGVKNICHERIPKDKLNTNGYDYLCHKFASTKPKLRFNAKDLSEYEKWKSTFLRKIKKTIGNFPSQSSLDIIVTDVQEYSDYICKKVLISIEPDFAIPCLLTEPTELKNKTAAVLCLHGHGNGKSDMLNLCLSNKDNAIALHAAKNGFVTLSPDFLAFGERLGGDAPFGHGQDPCPAEFAWSMSVGLTTVMINLYTLKRCLDYLCTMEYVDSKKIICAGHSFGGFMTTLISALDKRIAAAVVSGFICDIEAYYGKSWTCGSQVIPGLFKYGDIGDIACTIAPRPLLVITGEYDSVTPLPFAKSAFRKIQKAYKLNKSSDVEHFIFDGDHIFHPERALSWIKDVFNKH